MKTAIQWLAEHINDCYYEEFIEQAKEIEKQQIIDAWKNGDGEFDEAADLLSEQYYNETFKSEE